MLQHEAPRRPQAQRRDHRLRAEFGFVVAVPAHAVAAVAIQVREHAVEIDANSPANRARIGCSAVGQGWGRSACPNRCSQYRDRRSSNSAAANPRYGRTGGCGGLPTGRMAQSGEQGIGLEHRHPPSSNAVRPRRSIDLSAMRHLAVRPGSDRRSRSRRIAATSDPFKLGPTSRAQGERDTLRHPDLPRPAQTGEN